MSLYFSRNGVGEDQDNKLLKVRSNLSKRHQLPLSSIYIRSDRCNGIIFLLIRSFKKHFRCLIVLPIALTWRPFVRTFLLRMGMS